MSHLPIVRNFAIPAVEESQTGMAEASAGGLAMRFFARPWIRAAVLLLGALLMPAPMSAKSAKPLPAVKLRGTATMAPVIPEPEQAVPIAPTAKVPDQPGAAWSLDEIAAAKTQCLTLLKGLSLEFTYAAPIRKGACGTAQPVEVTAFGSDPAIRLRPAAVMNCQLAARLSQWLQSSVQPLARAWLKSDVVELKNEAAYDCRNRYGDPGQKLSEHAKANALDIGAFTLANGKMITVSGNWGPVMRDLIAAAKAAKTGTGASGASGFAAKVTRYDGTPAANVKPTALPTLAAEKAARQHLGSTAVRQAMREEAAALGVVLPEPLEAGALFVHGVHASACTMFGTVLGPDANDAHREHFHLDLAPRPGSSYCE